jgi:uncharacterized membrane protein
MNSISSDTPRGQFGAGQIALALAATAIAFGILDGVWLGMVGLPFYLEAIGGIMQMPPRILPAGLFYVGYVAGVVYFVVLPAARKGGPLQGLLQGALLGAFAYGTYDLTNLATLAAYTWKIAAIDMAWGTFATALSAAAGTAAIHRR